VTLPPASDPPSVRRERLLGHPRAGIPVIACHEGYPGHHLQLSRAADLPSPARKSVRSNVFIEGWGLYVEELMTEIGYLGSPETRLLRLKDLLWRAARVLVDVGLATSRRYNLASVPSTYFVGPDGTVRHIEIGEMDEEEIRRGIAKAR
jgi:hypothetical protein